MSDVLCEFNKFVLLGLQELKKLLLKNFGLEVCKIKSPKRREFAYLCFRSQEDVDKAIKGLTGFQWKRHTLKASVSRKATFILSIFSRNRTNISWIPSRTLQFSETVPWGPNFLYHPKRA